MIRLEAAWRHRLACAGAAACRPAVVLQTTLADDRRRQTPANNCVLRNRCVHWYTMVTRNKYVRLRGRTYIHTCRSYVRTSRDFTNGASLAWRLRRCISTVMLTCGWVWPARFPIRLILGFCGAKFTKNGRFPALDADEPPCEIWRR